MGNIIGADELEATLRGKSFGLARPPKCGGSHAATQLRRWWSGGGFPGLDYHYHLNQKVSWGSYKILPPHFAKEHKRNERIFIGLIRNPYDWLVSFYCYAISRPPEPTAGRNKNCFLAWLKGAWVKGEFSCPRIYGDPVVASKMVPHFVDTYMQHCNIIHWTLMKEKSANLDCKSNDWSAMTQPGAMTLEPWPQIFIRSEYLNQGLNQFFNLKAGGKIQASGKTNVTPGATTSIPYKQWYDEEAIEMVAEKHKEELDLFGYEFSGINKMDGPIIRI